MKECEDYSTCMAVEASYIRLRSYVASNCCQWRNAASAHAGKVPDMSVASVISYGKEVCCSENVEGHPLIYGEHVRLGEMTGNFLSLAEGLSRSVTINQDTPSVRKASIDFKHRLCLHGCRLPGRESYHRHDPLGFPSTVHCDVFPAAHRLERNGTVR